MSFVEVLHFEAIWWEDLETMRVYSALSAVCAWNGKPIGKIRILPLGEGSEEPLV